MTHFIHYMLSVVMLNVIMLRVVMLIVIMLGVVAPSIAIQNKNVCYAANVINYPPIKYEMLQIAGMPQTPTDKFSK
jgi:hypothetical protein